VDVDAYRPVLNTFSRSLHSFPSTKLVAFEPQPQDSQRWNLENVWSVGWNGLVREDQTYKPYFLKYLQHVGPELAARIWAKADGQYPNPTDIFGPGTRTITFGQLRSASCQQDEPFVKEVCMSAWYGRSGAMICALETTQKQICIIGLRKLFSSSHLRHTDNSNS
jgi:hypothetical protein